ncbi:MAG: butyrate kinase [Eubacteriales bacterium]|nr:butyrate kinase [Eubacteriales bacterium]
MYKILAINPGSTSTKISLYEDEREVFVETLIHDDEELRPYKNIPDQYKFREEKVLSCLKKNNFNIEELSAVVGRGGILPPLKSGAYKVNDVMLDILKNRPRVEHASNLGGIIAYEIAKMIGVEAYIYDSVAVDELEPIARITGIPEVERVSLLHALNMRACAIKVSKDMNKRYEDCKFVVAHLGGGITLSVHSGGKMVDLLSDDEGPFAPERSGRVPGRKMVDLCFSGQYNKNDITKKMRGNGGLKAHLNTVDAREVQKMIDQGDQNAKLIFEAMAYQIAKGIGELATVVKGDVDGVILTGGLAYSKMLMEWIKERVEFIGDVIIIPGENEMEALTLGTLRVLRGEEACHEFIE